MNDEFDYKAMAAKAMQKRENTLTKKQQWWNSLPDWKRELIIRKGREKRLRKRNRKFGTHHKKIDIGSSGQRANLNDGQLVTNEVEDKPKSFFDAMVELRKNVRKDYCDE